MRNYYGRYCHITEYTITFQPKSQQYNQKALCAGLFEGKNIYLEMRRDFLSLLDGFVGDLPLHQNFWCWGVDEDEFCMVSKKFSITNLFMSILPYTA